MASPFTFFRKYSSGMMIVMVILSMLLFTLTDLFSDPSAKFWLLGLLVGGAVFGIAGISQGKWLQWGIGGSVLGVAMGLILPAFAERGGISTSIGVVTEEEQFDLSMRRAIANRFLYGAIEQTYGPMFFQFQRPPQFGFRQRTETEDLIFGKLMRAEADRLGLEVSPAMVKKYLADLTNNELTKSQYLAIRDSLSYNRQPLSEDLVNEILGDEIRAKMAYDLTAPMRATVPPPPEVYWEYYKRLKVQQDLELVAVDVDAFVDQVSDPGDAEIKSLFDEYKNMMPNQKEPGSPGFFLPTRVKVAYAELDNDKLKNEIAAVTEEDIQKYYEENKESPLIRVPVFPDLGGDTEESPEDAPEADSESPPGEGEGEPAANDEGSGESTETPGEAGEPSADDATEATAEPDATEPTEQKPSETPANPAGSDSPTEEPATDPESTETPEPPAEPDDCGMWQENAEATDEPVASESADEPVATESEDEPAAKQSTDEPATEQTTTPPTEPATETGTETAGETPADEATEESADGASGDEGAPTLSLEIPDKPEPGTTPPEMPEPTYEYRELDEELSTEIKEVIEAERIDTLTSERLAELKSKMELIAREREKQQFAIIDANPRKYEVGNDGDKSAYEDLQQQMLSVEAEWNAELKKYATEKGFAYVETKLLGYSEFINEEDYPIALATEPVDNPMMASNASTVAQTLFQGFNQDPQNNNAQMFIPRQAQKTDIALTGGTSYYVYWAIGSDKAHEPTLEESGVRESVILAYKQGKARELAEARAEALATKIREVTTAEGTEEQGFAEILKDETATGDEDSSALAPRRTLPFSWMKTSSAGQRGMQQQATLSTIEFRDDSGGFMNDVGRSFMETIFTDMSDEEVGVVPNFDLSKYYVVHIQNRFPTAEVGEEGLRDQFATEGKQFSFRNSAILPSIQQDLTIAAMNEWEMSIWRKYGVIEAEPESE